MSCTDCADVCSVILEHMCHDCNKRYECHGEWEDDTINHDQMIECIAEQLSIVEHIIHLKKGD